MWVGPVEFRAGQFDEDLLDHGRDIVQHVLELFNFLLLLVDVFLDLDSPLLVLRGIVEDALFLLIVLLELLILGPQVLVDVHQVVDFLIEHVDVGEQVVVLFFSLDEGVLDLEDVGESGGFLDGGEGLVDDLHVALVVVNQFHFFLIVDDQFGESLFEDCGGVVLDGFDFSGFDSAAAVEFGVFEFLVEACEFLVVVVLVLLVLHFEAQHEVLAHFAGVLAALDVLHQ
jgi:hypothetical protein